MSAPAPPPFADATDEALSALLDGALASFAADHGLTEPEARARLEAWPELATRLAALALARDALAAPVEALDDLTRRHLVRDAVAAARTERARDNRRSPAWTWLAAAAAAVVLVVGIGALVSLRGSEQANLKSSAGSPTAERDTNSVRGDLGNVGDVSDPAALRALLDRAPAPAATGTTNADEQQGAPRSSNDGFARSGRKSADCAPQLFGDRPVLFHGSATYRGEPAVVLGVEDRGRTVVLVVRADNCATVLTSVSR